MARSSGSGTSGTKIQDIDRSKDNYGIVAANVQRIDLDYFVTGDVMGGVPADWTHFNAVDYHPDLTKPSFSSVVELTLPAKPQQWHLADSAAGTVRSFHVGVVPATWVPLRGDRNGDGVDSVGFYNPATRTFQLHNRLDDAMTSVITARARYAGPTW
ncbi:MAG: hypothetical protein FJ284_11840 [Planctomycetes bacterium]|nr:hypothetical protein [Planctomycetota bacterium]